MAGHDLRVAIAGLGAASNLVLPAFDGIEGVRLAAGCDTREQARAGFAAKYGLPVYDTIEALSAAPDIDAIWIETPNHLHCEHSVIVARGGKHVICAKPVGVTIEECDRMIAAARDNGVHLMQGHAKTFDPPIEAMSRLVATGELGAPVHVETILYNDWLQRPRLAEELDSAKGGGIVLRQGPHQIDIVRRIVGSRVTGLRAYTGRHDPNFATEGNYTAHLEFENGATAYVGFNGYGFFDSNELAWNIGVYGKISAPGYAAQRRTGVLYPKEKYADGAKGAPAMSGIFGDKQPFFGVTILSCERGVVRQSPDGLFVYDTNGCREIPLPKNPGRAAELIELRDALRENRRAFPDGEWGRATLGVCLGIVQSSAKKTDVRFD